MPLYHPFIEIIVLIEKTTEKTERRQYEKTGEEADTHHETLQFIRTFAICLHNGTYAKERYKAGE